MCFQLLATHMAGNKHRANATKRERGEEVDGQPPSKRPCVDATTSDTQATAVTAATSTTTSPATTTTATTSKKKKKKKKSDGTTGNNIHSC